MGEDATVVEAVQGPGRVRRWIDQHRAGTWTPEAAALTAVTIALLVVGLVMSFSASFVDAAQVGDPFGGFRRQLLWAALGVPAFWLTSRLDHRIWRRLSWILLSVALVGLALVLVPGLGVRRFGSARWLGIGPLQFQPSELAKLALLLWLADVLERKRPRDGRPQTVDHLLIPALPVLGLMAVLVLAEPDLGTTILLGLIVALVLFVEGLPARLFVLFGALGAAAVGILAVVAPYRMARIQGWLDPGADPQGAGWQLLQSLYALGSGGVTGLGLGSSRGKWDYIPNPETDFIFSIVGEELGLLGAVAVLSLFAVLLVVGMRVARHAPSGFGATVAFATTGWIVGQALLNVATVTGLLPITGVTLPMLSVGGSSLVSTMVALGILVAIARQSPVDDSDGEDPARTRPEHEPDPVPAAPS